MSNVKGGKDIDPFNEKTTTPGNSVNDNGDGTYKTKPVPGGGGPKSTYTPEKD